MRKTLIIRHKVGNIDTWLKGHQDRINLFRPAMSSLRTFQDTQDPKSVTIAIDVTDMEKFEAIMKDPSTDALKAKHTVLDPIIVSMEVPV